MTQETETNNIAEIRSAVGPLPTPLFLTMHFVEP